jgi:signal transduction histidine kinase
MSTLHTIGHASSDRLAFLSKEAFLNSRFWARLLTRNFQDLTIGIINPEMEFIPLNEKTLFTDEEQRPLGKKDISWLGRDVRQKLKRAFSGKKISYETQQGDRFYKIKGFPVKNDTETIAEVLCIVQDITDQKVSEQNLKSELEKEKELGNLKSKFVAMASHEFRNPLTSILASTFLLVNLPEQDFNKDKFTHTARIKRSVNNLNNILNEFLSLQKLDENKVHVVYTKMNIPEFIQDNILSDVEVLKKPDQRIEYHHSSNQTFGHLDHHILWSILTNLLSNSIKYSNPNGVIQLTSEIEEGILKLIVSDQGIGIPEDQQHHIFERFFRARNALHIEGTGLGLHLVQKYVQLLNGSISFESHVNSGTNFTVVLPINHSNPQ